jgi:putative inorganic carbon (hco3(-)) transporter
MATIGERLEDKSITRRRVIAAAVVILLPAIAVGLILILQINLTLAMVGFVLFGLLAVMFGNPEITTLIVLFAMYANLTVVAIKYQNVPEILAASFFLLLGLPLLNHIIVKRRKFTTDKVLYLMAVYLGIQLLSATFSPQPRESMGRITNYLLEGMALYFLITNTIRKPELLRKGIWALILAGVFMGSLSMYQEFTGSYDNDFGGLAQVKDSEIDTGRVDYLGNDIKRYRLSGPIGSKNRYGQIMVVLLPLALFRIWAERSRAVRLLAVLSCIPIISGALLTFSRGAGLSIIITFLAMILLRVIKLRYLLIMALLSVLVVAAFIPDYIYRISTVVEIADLASGDEGDVGASFRGRATVNLAAIYIFLDNPIVGVGPGQTNSYTYEYGNEVGYRRLEGERRAHNMYLEELADTGVLGFSIFMGIIGYTAYQLNQLRRYYSKSRPEIAYTVSGLLLALVAFLSTSIFLHLSYVRYYYLILALAAVAINVYRTDISPGKKLETELG